MIFIFFLALLLGAGCSGLSAVELADCRDKIKEMQAMKVRLVEVMNNEANSNRAHGAAYELAYLQYRALSMNVSLFHRDPTLIVCWGTEP